MMKRITIGLLLFFASRSYAHVDLTYPESRYGKDILKEGPCGQTGGTRSQNVSTYRPGQTIAVQWDEFIPHPGHFRLWFDADGHDDFLDPSGFEDFITGNPYVLDRIADSPLEDDNIRYYKESFPLPNVECNNCTLQLMQVMTDKLPYGDGNDLYYQCADIVLSLTGDVTPGPDANPGDDDAPSGSSCQIAPGSAALPPFVLATWALLFLMFWYRLSGTFHRSNANKRHFPR